MRVFFEGSVEVPDGTPLDHVETWLKFELGERASLPVQNELVPLDIKSADTKVRLS